jgi:hypothetical protein
MTTIEEDDSTETVATPSPLSLLDVGVLEKYIIKACGVLLDLEGDAELAAFEKAVKDGETNTTLKKFISNAKSPVLVIQKVAKGKI